MRVGLNGIGLLKIKNRQKLNGTFNTTYQIFRIYIKIIEYTSRLFEYTSRFSNKHHKIFRISQVLHAIFDYLSYYYFLSSVKLAFKSNAFKNIHFGYLPLNFQLKKSILIKRKTSMNC